MSSSSSSCCSASDSECSEASEPESVTTLRHVRFLSKCDRRETHSRHLHCWQLPFSLRLALRLLAPSLYKSRSV